MDLEILSIVIAAAALFVSAVAVFRPDPDKRRMADALEKLATRGDRTAVDVQKLREKMSPEPSSTGPDFTVLAGGVDVGGPDGAGTWILEPAGPNRYWLVNGSDHDVFDVSIQIEGATLLDVSPMPIAHVSAGEKVGVSVSRPRGGRGASLHVDWARDAIEGAQHTWDRPLP